MMSGCGQCVGYGAVGRVKLEILGSQAEEKNNRYVLGV